MAFNDLQFSETDARKIQDRLQRIYEEIRRASGESGYRLAAADPERLVQLTEAAALTQVATDIDKTGKKNLLYFADDHYDTFPVPETFPPELEKLPGRTAALA